MEEMEFGSTEQNKILCCQCGTLIEPNPANMCVGCVKTQVDISEEIPKQCTLNFCRACDRYLQPPAQWVPAALESKELLSLCLKKLKNLSRVRLVDAGFVWTEPHSRRIKVKLTIQKEVFGGAILQHTFVVEYIVQNQMCDDCHRVEAKDFWRAVTQIRQKATHKKTLYYMEQVILKHKAHKNTLNIKPCPDGVDFYFASKQDARKMEEFLKSVVPCRTQTSDRMISHDVHNNTYVSKHTISVEVVPVCKDEIVCLPHKLAHQMGGINRLCICARITNAVHLIDPFTAQVAELSSEKFWKDTFHSICGPKQLTEFTVMNIEKVQPHELKRFPGMGAVSHKHEIADVWVLRSSDLGLTEDYIHTRSYLGRLLKIGDLVLGFDVVNSNVSDRYFDQLKQANLPDVILVKKVYSDSNKRMRKRKWKLRHLNPKTEEDAAEQDKDWVDFVEDLEEDEDLRQHVNIYRDATKGVTETDTEDDDAPRIGLEEMLEDLHLTDEDDVSMDD